MDLFVKFLPGTLTMSEMFNFLSLNAYYLTFAIDSFLNRDRRLYIAGNNTHNIFIFSPWVVLNLSLVLAFVFSKFLRMNKVFTAFASFTTAFGLTFTYLIKELSLKVFIKL